MLTYKTEGKNQYTVFWDHDLNGGGMNFGPEYPSIISNLYPNRTFECCLEWCSGPGFIGYNLLDHGLCNTLVLNDIYQPAIDIANHTRDYNNLNSKVSTFCSQYIDSIPNNIKFDLVVGNPPHYNRPYINDKSRIADDHNWNIHRYFYSKIESYLADDGIIILQENEDGSRPEDFYDMIDQSNLKLTDVIKSPKHYLEPPNLIYYIISQKR